MLFYPITPPSKLFNIKSLDRIKITLLHTGKYLRNYDFFLLLP